MEIKGILLAAFLINFMGRVVIGKNKNLCQFNDKKGPAGTVFRSHKTHCAEVVCKDKGGVQVHLRKKADCSCPGKSDRLIARKLKTKHPIIEVQGNNFGYLIDSSTHSEETGKMLPGSSKQGFSKKFCTYNGVKFNATSVIDQIPLCRLFLVCVPITNETNGRISLFVSLGSLEHMEIKAAKTDNKEIFDKALTDGQLEKEEDVDDYEEEYKDEVSENEPLTRNLINIPKKEDQISKTEPVTNDPIEDFINEVVLSEFEVMAKDVKEELNTEATVDKSKNLKDLNEDYETEESRNVPSTKLPQNKKREIVRHTGELLTKSLKNALMNETLKGEYQLMTKDFNEDQKNKYMESKNMSLVEDLETKLRNDHVEGEVTKTEKKKEIKENSKLNKPFKENMKTSSDPCENQGFTLTDGVKSYCFLTAAQAREDANKTCLQFPVSKSRLLEIETPENLDKLWELWHNSKPQDINVQFWTSAVFSANDKRYVWSRTKEFVRNDLFYDMREKARPGCAVMDPQNIFRLRWMDCKSTRPNVVCEYLIKETK